MEELSQKKTSKTRRSLKINNKKSKKILESKLLQSKEQIAIDYILEMELKNEAYGFIIGKELIDEFKKFCKN